MLDSRKPPPSTPASSIGSAMGREQGTREFSFSSADFERVRKLIYQHAGISLSPVKQDMVYSRLARRCWLIISIKWAPNALSGSGVLPRQPVKSPIRLP